MSKQMKSFVFEKLAPLLYHAGIKGKERDALGQLLQKGLGVHELGSEMKSYEFDNFMDDLRRNPELKTAGWSKYLFDKAEPVLQDHFVPLHEADIKPLPANDDEEAEVA